ncbi:antA/AntB antirepressor family protein [Bartonella sp. WD16.2]|uniref:antA/AntB antirepressor family protein n=1 Tax=Bartonella sp. WD16.2 TaxID=1933904 RepID=UPI000998EBF9|nr:antA/AntB antirepressor family protein [Bartonella sp. WD16.2]AQX19244.1 Phage anti-repressor protein [Bartonella sp. WD16.2]
METPITHQNNTTDQETVRMVRMVKAHILHERLKVKTNFNDWITQRIQEYEFEEGEDFRILPSEDQDDDQKKKYYLTVDMAKKLARAEKSGAGRIVYQHLAFCA